MAEQQLHGNLVLAIFLLAIPTFLVLFRITAPYGRHFRAGWGPTIPARAGWMVMESPAALLFAAVFWLGDHGLDSAPIVFFFLWQLHYVNRTFIYPLRIHTTGKRIPLLIAGMAFLFNVVNAYINARWISHFGVYPASWLTSTAFIAGLLCFLAGFMINQHADTILLGLRKRGETNYQIPTGGLYRWVSCPNYLGEILEWLGWAIATWSLAGAAFAVFTMANLLPRALANHRWYRSTFDNYPPSRRAVIPFLV